MRKILLIQVLFILSLTAAAQQSAWPDSIYSGKQGTMHVQGIAVDKAKGVVYFSFTDKLIKMDLSGKLIGSVVGFVGHLGDIDITQDGKIYGSLEYKDDAIGKGIKKQLGIQDGANQDGFYIAIFDGDKIIRPDMNAEKEDLVRAVYLPEVLNDYAAEVNIGDKKMPHRFACSGIDGVTFAPAIGSRSPQKYLYVAYGIYGDTTRNDNDYQVILRYNTRDWDRYAQPLSQSKLHQSGPAQPLDKYFVKTGNTRYGIQNLAFDASTGNFFAAVYHGSKSGYPNYDLFVIDGYKAPVVEEIISDNKKVKVKTLALTKGGNIDTKTGTSGWHFPWGATGLCPIGEGLFYISHNAKSKDGQQQSTVHLYKWTADAKKPFVLFK